jgi:predicted hotdog family 3-hydroxylacyl-ACP dehydratase
MSAQAKHYDVIRKPIITEKATMASEANAVVFEVAIDANKPQIKDAVRSDLWCEGESGEHHDYQRQGKALQGHAWKAP